MKKIDVRPEVQKFSESMEFVLRLNDHKGGWLEDSQACLFQKLLSETAELLDAMIDNDSIGIEKEATDVANYAMMIFDQLQKKKEKEKGV